MKNRQRRLYRMVSLILAATFATVGLIFIILPDQMLEFFNRISPLLKLPPAPVQSGSFFPILAIAYMYLVTLLTGLMFRKPDNRLLPLLLAQGKFASSMASLFYFFFRAPYLICLANAVVDGLIGALVMCMYFLQKKHAGS